jgi:hypothetical protein
MNINYNGQALQDKFVISVLEKKQNGFFLEIGSNDPININNTYILEKYFNWKGIMVEYDNKWLLSYIETRPNSIHIIDNALKVNYNNLFKINNFPKNIDYLQIDLEVSNGSTINTLELLNNTIFNEYKFATITFEHDIYCGNYFNTKFRSREIFNQNGYFLVYGDVKNDNNPFEDWYVHPDLVNMGYINKIKRDESLNFNEIIKILDTNQNN